MLRRDNRLMRTPDTAAGHGREPLAVITGASSGIGREIASGLARRGYRTVLIARRAHLLEDLAADLSRHAPSHPVVLDLADRDSIAPAAARITAAHGPARVLINCAGFGAYEPFLEHSHAEFDRLMRVNFEAVVHLTRALLPGLIASGATGGAHVFNICSMSARVGPWGHAAYASSKGAMRAFTEVLHAEHANRGVHFTIVYPGVVRTEYFKKGTMSRLWPLVERHAVSVERVAGAVMRALEAPRVTLYVPWHYRVLDWIAAASPRTAWWLVRRGSRADGATQPSPMPDLPPIAK
jgi:short-subunit dehydrogenase